MRRIVGFIMVAIFAAVPAFAGQTPRPTAVAPKEAPPAIAMPDQVPPTPPAPPRTPTPAPGRHIVVVPTTAPPAPQAAAAPRQPDQRIDQSDVNIKLTVTITDKAASGTLTKTVSVLMANRDSGRVRSSGSTTLASLGLNQNRSSELNVDASATLFKTGSIRTMLTISYTPEWTEDATKMTGVTQSVTLFLKDGVPTIVTQAADPTKGSRSVTIEVTASIVK